MRRSKKRFREYSPGQQAVILAVAVFSLGLIAFAERDIQRISAADVRGSKAVWRLVCLNALGAVAYLGWGRRRG